MNSTLTRMYSLLTAVRRSMECWTGGTEDTVSHTILMVMFSLPVKLLDEICGDVQKTKMLTSTCISL